MQKLLESRTFWYALIVFMQAIIGILTATEVNIPLIEPEFNCPVPAPEPEPSPTPVPLHPV